MDVSAGSRRGGRRSHTRWVLLAIGMGMLAGGCAEPPQLDQSEGPREPVEVGAAVDRAVATTGDLITFRVTADYDPAWEVEIPEAGAEIAGFRIVDVGREEKREVRGRVIDERWYRLRADLVGSYVLPPVEIRYRPIGPEGQHEGQEVGEWNSVSTSEIFVEVESVLPADGEAEDIRGLKSLRRVRRPMPWLWMTLGVVGTLLLATMFWIYWRWRARRIEAQPAVPPHELAFRALEALRQTDFDDDAAVRRFYFGVSEAIRAYVEGRFGLNATDLTTEEILAGLPALHSLESVQNQILRRFLVDTDQVKFAHHSPSKGEIEATYERALGFVEKTRSVTEVTEKEAA